MKMLDSMRRNANSWIFTLIFAVITFVFAINFGPWVGNVGPKVSLYAAQVNGRIISVSELESAYGAFYKRLQGVTEEQAKMLGIKERTLDTLISRELLAQLAEQNNVVVTDEELVAYIKNGYLGGQNLDPSIYENAVQSQFGISAGEFDRRERRNLMADRMRKILETGARVSESDARLSFNLSNEKIAIDYIKVSPGFFPDPAPLSAEQLVKWTNEHEEEIKSEYARQSGEKKYEEMREEIAKKLYAKQQKTELAKEFAESILSEVKSGQDLSKIKRKGMIALKKGEKPVFSEVAPLFASTELFSRNENFGQGVPRQVSAEAFKLAKDEAFSEVVFSNESFYVAKVADKKGADESLFEEQKDAIKNRLTSERKADFVQNYIDYLKKEATIVINEELLNS